VEPSVELRPAGRPLRLVPAAPDAPASDTGPPRLLWRAVLVRVCVAVDLVAISLAVLAVLLIEHRSGARGTRLALFGLGAIPLWLLAMNLGRAHEARFLALGSEEFKRVFDAAVRLAAVIALAGYGLHADLPRPLVVVALPAALALDLSGRYAVRKAVHRLRRGGRCGHRVLLVGSEHDVNMLIRELRRVPYTGMSVVGSCVDEPLTDATILDGDEPCSDPHVVFEAALTLNATAIAITSGHGLDREFLRRLAWVLEGTDIELMVAPALTDAGPRIHIRPVAGLPLLHIEKPELSGGHRLLKTTVDRIVATVALLVLLPGLVAVGVAVRLTSRGPALYRQRRTGRGGREFVLYKFRTMHVGADAVLAELAAHNDHADDGLLFKMRRDPRLTRVGAWLRRYSIDELPQLFNVIKGDMSLVGPRPPLPTEVAQYAGATGRRMLVSPGLTGLWQVSGRADLDWEESVRLDLYYVENWSLALDLLILWKTVPAVLRHRGAY
jgi:exopolysaccharide biosynthesis polyprenyl glycosylphosphotransferase